MSNPEPQRVTKATSHTPVIALGFKKNGPEIVGHPRGGASRETRVEGEASESNPAVVEDCGYLVGVV